MKREFLQNFQVGEQPLPKEVIDAILDENSRDIDATKAKYPDYDTMKQQLTEANQTIEGFKAMDVDGIKAAADELKAKAEQAERDAAAKIADMAFESALASAIGSYKGKNAKGIAANLDLDALKASKNQEADIKAALEALKESDAYLFDTEQTPPPYAPGAGKNKMTGVTKEDYTKMGYSERLKLKQDNPETYERMKGM